MGLFGPAAFRDYGWMWRRFGVLIWRRCLSKVLQLGVATVEHAEFADRLARKTRSSALQSAQPHQGISV
jgi:hypothetical protein